eukprot:4719589-Pleurochrysis_carterae.AAC.8
MLEYPSPFPSTSFLNSQLSVCDVYFSASVLIEPSLVESDRHAGACAYWRAHARIVKAVRARRLSVENLAGDERRRAKWRAFICGIAPTAAGAQAGKFAAPSAQRHLSARGALILLVSRDNVCLEARGAAMCT